MRGFASVHACAECTRGRRRLSIPRAGRGRPRKMDSEGPATVDELTISGPRSRRAWQSELLWASAVVSVAALLLTGCAAALSEVGRDAPSAPAAPGAQAGSEPAVLSTTDEPSSGRADAGPGGELPAAGGRDGLASLPDIASVADRVSSAVVSIKTETTRTTFFGLIPREGEGSGFIIDREGHVITNAHVLAGARSVTVTLPDGRAFPDSAVVGADTATDLAVIRISGDDLPVVQMGTAGDLRVGSWVVAVGNSLGLGTHPTVTAGIVSAVDRTVQMTAGCPPLGGLIQTDAAINPGNSGGPLFDLHGRVIGINTAVQRSTLAGVTVEGVGFAIAVDAALPVVEELIEKGFVEKPWIGVGIYTVTPSIAARFSLRAETGVFVNNVFPRSAAERAGLRPGQVITRIDGVRVTTQEELLEVVASHSVGDQVVIGGVDYGGDEFTRRLTLSQQEGCDGAGP